MKLLTPNIIQALPPIQSTAHISLESKTIICKFSISNRWSWYVFEGEVDAQKGYKFFGLIVYKDNIITQAYMGYFYLSELLALIEAGHKIQLAPSLFKASYNDVLKKVVAKITPLCRRFLIEKIIRALPPIGNTKHIPLNERTVICGFYLPNGPRWYVFEGEFTVEYGYQFFGIIDRNEKEWGYFYLSELLEVDNTGNPVSIDYAPAFNVCYGDIFAPQKK